MPAAVKSTASPTTPPTFDFAALEVTPEAALPSIRRTREGGPNPLEPKVKSVPVGKAGSITLPARHAPDGARLIRRAAVVLGVSVRVRFGSPNGQHSYTPNDEDKLRAPDGKPVHDNTQVKVTFEVRELKPRDRFQCWTGEADKSTKVGKPVSLTKANAWLRSKDVKREYPNASYSEITPA